MAYKKIAKAPDALRSWAPPGVDLRVDYANGLLRHLDPAAEYSGVLLGNRRDGQVQVIAAQCPGENYDTSLETVGIFSIRLRGEIFLTEFDLGQFCALESKPSVALVAIGARAGFFVHEPDGSIQSIQSHQEFAIFRQSPDKPPRRNAGPGTWAWPAFALAAIPLMAFPGWRPHPSLDLSVHKDSGQLRISWTVAAVRPGMLLEIIDGGERRSIPVFGTLTSATYQPLTRDVQIHLGTESIHIHHSEPSDR